MNHDLVSQLDELKYQIAKLSTEVEALSDQLETKAPAVESLRRHQIALLESIDHLSRDMYEKVR